MTREDLLKRVSINPNVCFGKACIRGTRIWVALILDRLSDGETEQDILESYPQLSHDDIMASLCYAAEMTRERIIPSSVEMVQV